ncbi:MAG: hypothetical protein ACXWV4_06590 [Flavitalea sp.]
MKKLFFALTMMISIGALSQDKMKPEIKQGTQLTYIVNVQGQELPLLISLDSVATDYIKMGWNIEQLGTGSWIMKKNSLDKATRAWWEEPAPGAEQEVADEQLVLLLSKAQWEGITGSKKFDYDLQSFTPITPTEQQVLKLNNKVIDALVFQGENGSTRLWILNDPIRPMILKIEGNTMGPDLTVSEIK